jgi:hypothetical protein
LGIDLPYLIYYKSTSIFYFIFCNILLFLLIYSYPTHLRISYSFPDYTYIPCSAPCTLPLSPILVPYTCPLSLYPILVPYPCPLTLSPNLVPYPCPLPLSPIFVPYPCPFNSRNSFLDILLISRLLLLPPLPYIFAYTAYDPAAATSDRAG